MLGKKKKDKSSKALGRIDSRPNQKVLDKLTIDGTVYSPSTEFVNEKISDCNSTGKIIKIFDTFEIPSLVVGNKIFWDVNYGRIVIDIYSKREELISDMINERLGLKQRHLTAQKS